MKIQSKIIRFKTKKEFEYIDITDKVQGFIKESKVKDGQILVFSRHTTMAIRVNEKEDGFFKDFEQFFTKILPKEKYYKHNDLNIRTENLVCSDEGEECLNGHSHCQHFLLGTSETIPVVDSKLALGRWQKVIAIELCGPRDREVHLQLLS